MAKSLIKEVLDDKSKALDYSKSLDNRKAFVDNRKAFVEWSILFYNICLTFISSFILTLSGLFVEELIKESLDFSSVKDDLKLVKESLNSVEERLDSVEERLELLKNEIKVKDEMIEGNFWMKVLTISFIAVIVILILSFTLNSDGDKGEIISEFEEGFISELKEPVTPEILEVINEELRNKAVKDNLKIQ